MLALAILEHGPSSGSALARHVVARKGAVLDVLVSDPRFEQLSAGRGSRWRLRMPRSGVWEPQGTVSKAHLDIDAIPERLAALERRVARLERLGAETAPAA
jgi:hypothetical protein